MSFTIYSFIQQYLLNACWVIFGDIQRWIKQKFCPQGTYSLAGETDKAKVTVQCYKSLIEMVLSEWIWPQPSFLATFLLLSRHTPAIPDQLTFTKPVLCIPALAHTPSDMPFLMPVEIPSGPTSNVSSQEYSFWFPRVNRIHLYSPIKPLKAFFIVCLEIS